MQQLNKTWTPDLINSNTYMLAQKMGGAEKIIELEVFKGALTYGAGIILASSKIDYAFQADELKKLAEDAGKKMFFVNFADPSDSMGFNPFLTMETAQIARFFFDESMAEYVVLAEALSKVSKPITPWDIVRTFHANDKLYTSLKPIIDSLELATETIVALNNTNESNNVDLRSIANEGHVLVLGAIDESYNLDVIQAFIKDYFLNPVFSFDLMKQDKQKPFYFISSSDAVLDKDFLINILRYGRKHNLYACFTDYRTKASDLESMNKIFSYCHNRIWGVQKDSKTVFTVLENHSNYKDLNKIIFLGRNDVKEILNIPLIPFKVTYQKQSTSNIGNNLGVSSMGTEIIYAVDKESACDTWERLHKDDHLESDIFFRLWHAEKID